MERPQIVLIALVGIGLAAAAFLFSAHKTTALEKGHRAEIEKLERKLAKLDGGEPAEGEGPKTADLLPETDSNTSEEHLQDQVSFLEEQLNLLRDENARLLAMVDRLETKLKSAGGTGEARAFSVPEEEWFGKVKDLTTKSRDLPLKQEVEVEFTDWEGMAQVVSETIRPQRTPEQQAKLSRAYAAMGFVSPATDVTREITNLLASQLGAALYKGDNKIAFNQDGSLTSVYDRAALAVAFDHVLQGQNFDLGKVPVPTQTNDDAYTAADALLTGDASIIKLRHMMYDTAAPTEDLKTSPTALSKEDFNAVTPFVREYFLFPYTAGQNFVEVLHEKGRWKSVNAAIQSPPGSTAEILHPELYLADEPFVPEAYDWPADKLEVEGSAPLWNNVAGELGISIYLNRGYYKYTMSQKGFYDTDLPPLSKIDLQENPGSIAAKGWRGDRYLVYANGEGAGGSDHVYWRSKWASANDAAEFFHGVRVALSYTHNLSLPQSDYEFELEVEEREAITPETTGRLFEKTTSKGRQIRVELDADRNEVTVINAGGKEWLKALRGLGTAD